MDNFIRFFLSLAFELPVLLVGMIPRISLVGNVWTSFGFGLGGSFVQSLRGLASMGCLERV